MIKKKRVSEFTSYIYIKQELSKLGWSTKNPARNPTGEVYTQQECLDQDEIKAHLGRQKPEYVVKLSEDKFYIIEAKPGLDDIDTAFAEAKLYAEQINISKSIKAVVISGVAGNDEDGYTVKSAFLEGVKFKTINYHGREITSLVSKEIANQLLTSKSASIPELKIDEKQLLRVAERINEVLHAGSINKDERASVMAALLLSMVDDTKPNYNATPNVFVKDINNRAENVLLNNSKREFFKHIEIKLPSNSDAQVKYKKSLVTTMFELQKINIKAAMNSGSDVLGQFYEVFLKYGNGAKDIGIVLTPRHITHFAARVLNITHKDIIYDPTCGTGGFLVAAFDHVRANSTKEQLEYFKKHKIFGIEQQPKVACLAIVNMIFRGDGKNNIVDNDCLSQSLIKARLNGEDTAEYVHRDHANGQPAVTKVLMNPPFALKDKDEKEFNFVQHALEQMEDGGLLFAVLPLSVMLKGGAYKTWRKNKLLPNNTLLTVITFPEDLFYPVGINACGVFIKKGYAHQPSQPVLWIRAMQDGYAKLKGRRLPDRRVPNLIEEIEDELKIFLQDNSKKIKSRAEFLKICQIDFSDIALELTPEVYLDSITPTIEEILPELEFQQRASLTYLISSQKKEIIFKLLSSKNKLKKTIDRTIEWKLKEFAITSLFDLQHGDFHSLNDLDKGIYPTISRVEYNNGIVGYYDKPDDALLYDPLTITVSTVTGDSFVQIEKYIATDNVVVLTPKSKLETETLFFISMMINKEKWRWMYGRQCYKTKFSSTIIKLPVDKDEIDEKLIKELISTRWGWNFLKSFLDLKKINRQQ